MGLFKSDLYRSFAVGFAVGAVLVGLTATDGLSGDFASPAQAAEMQEFDPVQASSEFIIESE